MKQRVNDELGDGRKLTAACVLEHVDCVQILALKESRPRHRKQLRLIWEQQKSWPRAVLRIGLEL